MARGKTRWSPDTCECVVEFYNDDFSFHQTVRSCAKHGAFFGSPQHLAELRAHNGRKNDILNDLIAEYAIDPQTEELPFVGYDPAADQKSDSVIVRGMSRIIQSKGLRIADRAMRLSDVTERLQGKFSDVRIED